MTARAPLPAVGRREELPVETFAPPSLLRRMLSLIGEGGIASTADMARQLRVSERLVAVMAEEMTRRGYLARVAGCAGGCGGCHVAALSAPAAACGAHAAAPGEMLMLTPKGRQAAAQP